MKRTIILPMIILLLASACKPATPDPINLTAADAGKTIELKSGDTLLVTLEGNLTTGYNWVMSPQDPAVLQQVGEPEVKADSDKLGSPGLITLKFKAATTGQTNLRLEYKRPWEKGVTPEITYEVNVVVK
jgi:inhibitor of cysteine peptidase